MKLWSIQVLRFVAALLVVYYHAVHSVFLLAGQYGFTGHAGAIVGRCGVDIFFVISGFIIARTARGLTVGSFIAKRAQRILPLYLMLIAIWTIPVALIVGLPWRVLLATWLFWPVTDVMTAPFTPVAWTLCFEVLFYAAFALVIWRRAMILLVAFVFAASLGLRPLAPAFQFLGNPIILEFLAGVGLAWLPAWRPALVALPIGAAVLVLGALLGWNVSSEPLASLIGGQAWLRVAALGLPSVLVVWGVLQLRAREGVFTVLGDASYALYLVHFPIVFAIAVVCLRWGHLPADVAIVLATIASVLLAWRIHVLFEKPALAWLRRQRRAPTAELAA